SSSPTVHPHARGDDWGGECRSWGHSGSPPRAWGRLAGEACFPDRPRFTPTRVGTTPGPHHRPGGSTVHPHARGDDPEIKHPFDTRNGSPPRAWGRRVRG